MVELVEQLDGNWQIECVRALRFRILLGLAFECEESYVNVTEMEVRSCLVLVFARR